MLVASTSRGETSLRSLAVPFLLLYLIVVYPLWAIPAPPLIDYPNHLARIFILANPQHPVLAQFYESHWGVLPNLAMELFATPLAMLLSVEVAGKLFISMIFLLVASGVLAAHYALHRRLSAWPWLSFFFLYNPFLLWGWLNYLFGLGLALWLFAAWLVLRERPSRWLVGPAGTLLLFFCHLLDFGVYMVLVSTYELGLMFTRGKEAKRLGSATLDLLSQGLVPAILFFSVSPTAGEGTLISLSGLDEKISALRRVFDNYVGYLDFKLTFVPLAAAVVVGLATRTVTVERRLLVPLAALLLIYAVLPPTLLTSAGGYPRFTIVLALFFIVACDLRLSAAWIKYSLIVALVSLLLTREWVLWQHWRSMANESSEMRAALQTMPAGSRLLVKPKGGSFSTEGGAYLWHVPCLAVIDRNAFVSSVFASPRQQPLRVRERYRRWNETSWNQLMETDLGALPFQELEADFDYVIVIGAEAQDSAPPRWLEEKESGARFALYAVRHEAHEAPSQRP